MTRKRILYINQYFKHAGEPGVTRSYWVCKRLIEEGYEVIMIAHRNMNHDFVEKDIPFLEIKNIDNIQVYYIKNAYDNNMNTFERIMSFVKFMLFSTWYALKIKDVDLVISTSTPLTVALPALMRKLIHKTPYIFEVRDLWPEGPIQLGFIRNGLVIKVLRWFEALVYKKAVHVVALSPGMQEGVVKYIPESKTSMIPNMGKNDRFWPRDINPDALARFGLSPTSFKVIYFGTLGFANSIPYILDQIRFYNEHFDREAEFIFMGHGRHYKTVEDFISTHGVKNVKLISRATIDVVSDVLNCCHASLVTFLNIPILGTNSPNKFFDTLSAGKLVIVNNTGWIKDLIEKNRCGFYVDPERPSDLAQLVYNLAGDRELVEEYGRNSRTLAENVFDKDILTEKYTDLVNRLLQHQPLKKELNQ